MKTNFHNKNFALILALKMRQARTRKWAINRLVEELFPCLLDNVRNKDSSLCTNILSVLKALVGVHTSDHDHLYDKSNWTSPLRLSPCKKPV